ncbi:hypothetical protein F750_5341 [Streptomyces sp. PAMC 26508]|nr:hypothetical protein F750_5341 [Streptomyces sp. PAMC 26508]
MTGAAAVVRAGQPRPSCRAATAREPLSVFFLALPGQPGRRAVSGTSSVRRPLRQPRLTVT